MRGTARPSLILGLVALGLLVGALACGRSVRSRGTTAGTASSEEGEPRPSRLSGPELACRIHSCAPPFYCNQESGVCEQLPCAASRECPYGYKCDFSRNVCQ